MQEHEKQENKAREYGQHHDCIENPTVTSSDSDPHQENADRDLACDAYEAIGNLTKPPVLKGRVKSELNRTSNWQMENTFIAVTR